MVNIENLYVFYTIKIFFKTNQEVLKPQILTSGKRTVEIHSQIFENFLAIACLQQVYTISSPSFL